MTMTTAADVMRRRLRAPLITLGIGGVVLVGFAAVLNRGGSTNEVQAFAGQATETSANLDDPTTSTVEASTSTQQGSDRAAAPTQARRTTVSVTSPTTAAAPTTAAPTTTTPTTVLTTAAPTTAAPTTAAPTTAAPTTAAPTTAAPTTAAPTTTSTAPSGPKCDPNYSGCVPIASDVDCAGGSGDGPAYVQGPINVIGTDIYGLDRDNDGIACE